MKRRLFGLLGAAALVLSASATAQKPPAVPLVDPATVAATLSSLDVQRLLSDAAYAAEALKSLEAIDADQLPREAAVGLDNLRTFALYTAGRSDEASRYAADLRRTRPAYPPGHTSGFIVELEQGHAPAALAVLEAGAVHLVGADRADFADSLSTDAVFALSRHFHAEDDEPSAGRLADALSGLKWTGEGSPNVVDNFRIVAIKHRLAAGDTAGARSLADQIDTPDATLDLVTLRKFDTLLAPDVNRAQRVASAIELENARTGRDLQASPSDWIKLLHRIHHLRSSGRADEAVGVALPAVSDMAAIEGAGEDAFWVVNEAAYALIAAGRGDEAIKLIDRLLALGIDKHSDLINMAINKGAMLLTLERRAEALAHSSALLAKQPGPASPYGEMFMSSSGACAAWELGRKDEAAKLRERLLARPDVNEAATLLVHLCTDDMEGAERFLVARLRSDEPDAALTWLQDYQVQDEPSERTRRLAARFSELARRPAVREAATRVGHILTLPLSRSFWGL